MAFNGSWYIKIGTYAIPLTIMKYGSYKSAPAQRQDLDGYVDANGNLHRNPVSHTRSKLEFNTIPMSEEMMREFMDNITAQYLNGLEKKVQLTYYEEEYGNYVTGYFYLSATQEYTHLNKAMYDSVRIALIEY